MARGTVTVADVSVHAGTVGTGGSIDTTNGLLIKGGASRRNLLLHINNTGVAGTVSIVPGDSAAALTSGAGTVTIAIAGTVARFFRVETALAAQANGDIHLNFTTNMAGHVYAYDVATPGV
jgi:hypothetical protein